MKRVYVIGGPNGAGKTTLAETMLPEYVGVGEFVNADYIARGLSPFRPESMAFQAGREMLKRIHDLAGRGATFGFETTLASRSFGPLLTDLKSQGYSVTLVYVWLRSAALARRRVVLRMESGGHGVPWELILRRYRRGLLNLRSLYLPLADEWYVWDNSDAAPRLVAEGSRLGLRAVHDDGLTKRILG